ncbi:aTPase/histidine kinase/DNA gyrase B/HSP90 domain protein [Clostridium sp. CAG:762]|nr:aTPase/histidine kinase/DNA gyrase B/HSP90 domain protein [Clostridium sp. CAG:762]
MEWGIKLKNNLFRKTFINFIIKSIVAGVVILLGTLTLIYITSQFNFHWLYDIAPSLYYLLSRFANYIFRGELIILLMFIVWLVYVILSLYRMIKKIFSYINAIVESSNNWFTKDTDYITLPDELSDLEKKLNYLKRESLTNEKLARENEQKKDELIVYLAHDIKTPLTSMIGYLSILNEMDDMPKKQQEKYIKIALDKSYRLEELINELFDVARFNSEKIILEKEKLNLNLMLAQIIDDFYPTLSELNKKIELNNEQQIMLVADPDKLGRVFNNLIKNAINYSAENSNIRINVRKNEYNIIVDIINEGRQIPKEKLDQIFEKFYRLDSSRISKTGGSGLGLAIAKDIVQLHGGQIKAISSEKETLFRVELPLGE